MRLRIRHARSDAYRKAQSSIRGAVRQFDRTAEELLRTKRKPIQPPRGADLAEPDGPASVDLNGTDRLRSG